MDKESFDSLPDIQLIRSIHLEQDIVNLACFKDVEVLCSSLPEPLVKTTSGWLSQRPVDALSKFAMW
ncbi:unnamed protein product [Calypogeia fissa]